MDSHFKHFGYLSIFFLFLLIQTSVSVSPYVKLENGGYKNIVVAIASDTDETHSTAIIESIKELFTTASKTLFIATKQWAYFDEVTIVIPSTWKYFNESLLQGVTSFETFYEADVRIDKPNPAFGNAPFTKQPHGCGQRGWYIHLTPDYLLNQKENEERFGNRGNVFVHEWAHLRYGVFEEYGYPNDPIYPLFYHHQSGIKRTLCTNTELQGHLKGKCNNNTKTGIYEEGCKFIPNTEQTLVTSSLMSLHYLPQMKYFCDNTTHNPLAPTKHNALCKGRSVLDVIIKNEDFVNSDPIDDSNHDTNPKFKILKENQSKYAILLEDTEMMNQFEKFDHIESALQRFIHLYIPSGSWLTYITFNENPEVMKELGIVTSETRQIFSNKLVRAPSNKKIANLETAILTAIEKLALTNNKNKENPKSGGVIILITTGNAFAKDKELTNKLCTKLQTSGTKLHVILYPSIDISSENAAFFQHLVACSSGSLYFIHERGTGNKGHVSALMELDSALRAALIPSRITSKPIRIFEKEWMVSSDINGEFQVDEDATRNLTFHSPNYKSIRKIILIDPQGNIFDDNSRHYKIDEKLSMIWVRVPQAKPGLWKYKVEIIPGTTQMSYPISVFSEASTSTPLTVRCWTNVGNKKVKSSEMPVILYAEVRQGSRAVIGAHVKANIFKPRDLTTGKPSFTIINLFDNGNGDPDISEGDGIYSHYFTDFSRTGFYTISVSAKGESDTFVLEGSAASGILPKNSDIPICCGSNRPSGFTQKRTNFFQREAVTGAFLVSEVSEAKDNKLPPSRIGNLEFKESNSKTGEVVISWIAPGADFDTGTASKYEIRYSARLEDLQELTFQQAKPVQAPTPQQAGNTEKASLILEEKDRYYFVGIRAWDEQNNFSPISNIITVMVPSVPITTTPSPEDDTSKVTGDDDSDNWMNDGKPKAAKASLGTILGAVFGVLAVIIIIALFYFCVYRRRRVRKYSTPRPNNNEKRPLPNKPISSSPNWKTSKEIEMEEKKKARDDEDNTTAVPLLKKESDKREAEDNETPKDQDGFVITSKV